MAIGGMYQVQNPAQKALGVSMDMGGGSGQQAGSASPTGAPVSGTPSKGIGGGIGPRYGPQGEAMFQEHYPDEYQKVFDDYATHMRGVLEENYKQAYMDGEYLPDTPENMAQSQVERGNGVYQNPVWRKVAGIIMKQRAQQGKNPDPLGISTPTSGETTPPSGDDADAAPKKE